MIRNPSEGSDGRSDDKGRAISGWVKMRGDNQDLLLMIRLKDSVAAAHQARRGCASQPQPR